MRGLNAHNIPVSITKLTLSLRVGFISFHLIADKLFQINPRAITGPPKMSLLEAKNMRALIIKSRFILVSHTDDLGWYIIPTKSNQPAGKDVRSKPQQDCQKAKCYAKAVPVLHQGHAVFQLT